MAELLEVGVEFESFDAFQAAMEQYEDTNFVQFSRIDSRSVDKAQETTPTKIYNPVIQFTQLTYACTFGPRKVASKSSGIRNSSSRKIDCPVRLRISSTPDGQRLVIRESKLDGHNHEVSEELYKSMARQKQLDEETEMEIYNLVSMHNDKRLARMLVRDRLTQEMGRSISIKDILNIEKKITRRLEREKESDSTAAILDKEPGEKQEEQDAEPDEESEGKGINERTEEPADTEESLTGENIEEDQGQVPEEEMEEDKEEDARKPVAEVDGDSNQTEKTPPAKKSRTQTTASPPPPPPSSSSSSSRRPQRHRREPSRFRDALANGTKVLHTSHDKVVSILSPEQAEEIGSEIAQVVSASAIKVKEEAGTRGRKRKVEEKPHILHSSEADDGADLDDYRKRKLAIQEKLLEMEKKKMKVLDDIMQKLDLILENQNAAKS